MRAILQINRSLAKKQGMNSSDKTVSEQALQEEWARIQAAQTDPSAFRPIYEQYYESLFRFVYSRILDEHLTVDIVSQVFLKALQKLPNYAFKGVPFSAWLYRIALNEISYYYRQNNKRRVVSLEDHSLESLWTDMDEKATNTDIEPMIQALDQLTSTDLQLVELRYFEKRPYREIAELLEITENNAKVRLHRILARLKRTLEK